MVASSITIDASTVLDGRVKNILVNSVGSLEDNTDVKTSDNGLVETNERWGRVKQNWNLSWATSTDFVVSVFKVNRQSRGFLYISPINSERVATGQLLRNTVTGLNLGDGSTTTFQLQVIDSTAAHSATARDINYPLTGTLVAYKNGVTATATVSLTTGIVTFSSAPANAVVPTADFEFAWPVHFVSKTIQTTYLQADQSELRSVQIEEIF